MISFNTFPAAINIIIHSTLVVSSRTSPLCPLILLVFVDLSNKHQHDYLKGNYNPALSDLTKLLNNLRSLCGLSIKVFFDGRANHHKRFEDQRRESNLIRNTPEYIARAAQICRFLGIEFGVSAYEADSQVTHYALHNRLVPITGDSDLLAIGSSEKPGEDDENCDVLRQLVVVKNKLQSESYRIIDLDAPHTNGNLPLYDLYLLHGRIVFERCAKEQSTLLF